MIGSKLDMKRRASKRLQRTYNPQTRSILSNARNLIFKEKTRINSAWVSRLLDDQSLVPTLVNQSSIIRIDE